MNILVMNPGGNSLKVEIVSCCPTQQFAFEGKKLISLIVEGIGKTPRLSVLDGKHPSQTDPLLAKDYGEAAASILHYLEREKHLENIGCVGVRVVHGGEKVYRRNQGHRRSRTRNTVLRAPCAPAQQKLSGALCADP